MYFFDVCTFFPKVSGPGTGRRYEDMQGHRLRVCVLLTETQETDFPSCKMRIVHKSTQLQYKDRGQKVLSTVSGPRAVCKRWLIKLHSLIHGPQFAARQTTDGHWQLPSQVRPTGSLQTAAQYRAALARVAPDPAPRGPAPGTLQAPPRKTPPLPPPESRACAHRDALRERARPGARGPRSAVGRETRACGSGEGGPGAVKGLKWSRGAGGGSGWASEALCSCGPGTGERACWEPGGRVGGGQGQARCGGGAVGAEVQLRGAGPGPWAGRGWLGRDLLLGRRIWRELLLRKQPRVQLLRSGGSRRPGYRRYREKALGRRLPGLVKGARTPQDLEILGFRGSNPLAATCFLYFGILFRLVAGQRLPLRQIKFSYTSMVVEETVNKVVKRAILLRVRQNIGFAVITLFYVNSVKRTLL